MCVYSIAYIIIWRLRSSYTSIASWVQCVCPHTFYCMMDSFKIKDCLVFFAPLICKEVLFGSKPRITKRMHNILDSFAQQSSEFHVSCGTRVRFQYCMLHSFFVFVVSFLDGERESTAITKGRNVSPPSMGTLHFSTSRATLSSAFLSGRSQSLSSS